jgi:hypothetical protein
LSFPFTAAGLLPDEQINADRDQRQHDEGEHIEDVYAIAAPGMLRNPQENDGEDHHHYRYHQKDHFFPAVGLQAQGIIA